MSKLRINELESLETGRSLKVDEIDSDVRLDLANPDKGAAMVHGAVIYVYAIEDLRALEPTVDGQQVAVKQYHAGLEGGGGVFYWDAVKDRSRHNGGTVIDPTVAFPTDWNSQTQLGTWFDTAHAGTGCWVRQYDGAINVKWFGAKGGLNDDTMPLQAAINSEKSIFVRDLYRASTLTLRSDIEIAGDGSETSGFLIVGSSSFLVAHGTESETLKNVTIKNLLFKRDSDAAFIYDFKLTENFKSIGNRFVGVPSITTNSYTVYYGCKDTVQRDEIYENQASCIHGSSAGATTTGIYGENNIIDNIVIRDAGQGLSLRYQNNLVLKNSVASGSFSTYGCGFLVEAECNNVIIENCTSYGHVRSGFYVEGNVALGIKGVKFLNCTGYGNGESGIVFDANYANVSVVGGEYYGNTGTFDDTGYGIKGSGSFSISIVGAHLHDNDKDGIWWHNAFKMNVVSCKIQANGRYGINLTESASNVYIDACQFTENVDVDVFGLPATSFYNFQTWREYTPTFFKQDSSTTVTPLTVFARYQFSDKTAYVQGYATFTAGVLDGETYISLPRGGDWLVGVGADALALLGICFENGISPIPIRGVYSNTRVNVQGTSPTTTTLAFKIEYPLP